MKDEEKKIHNKMSDEKKEEKEDNSEVELQSSSHIRLNHPTSQVI